MSCFVKGSFKIKLKNNLEKKRLKSISHQTIKVRIEQVDWDLLLLSHHPFFVNSPLMTYLISLYAKKSWIKQKWIEG